MNTMAYACCGLLLSIGTVAQDLTEKQLIQFVSSNKQQAEYAKLKLELKEIDREASLSVYSGLHLEVGGALGERYQQTDKNTQNNYTKNHRQQIREAYVKLNKKLFNSGAEISLKASRALPRKLDENYQNQLFDDYDYLSEQKNTLALNLKIPLLQNRHGDLDRKNYDISIINIQDEKSLIAQEKNKILFNYLRVLIDWGHQEALAKVYTEQLTLSEETENITQTREPPSTSLLLQNVNDRIQQKVSAAQHNSEVLKNKLATALPARNFTKLQPKINWAQPLPTIRNPTGYLRKHSLKLKRLRLEQQINRRHIKAYRNSLLPKFNLILRAEKNSKQGNYSHYSQQKNTDYEARLEFSYAFGETSPKIKLKKAHVKARLLRLNYNETFRDLLAVLKERLAAAKLSKKELKPYQQQVANSKQEINNEMQNYLNGKINIRFLLKAQKAWLAAKLSYSKALWHYRINVLKYQRALDRNIAKTLR